MPQRAKDLLSERDLSMKQQMVRAKIWVRLARRTAAYRNSHPALQNDLHWVWLCRRTAAAKWRVHGLVDNFITLQMEAIELLVSMGEVLPDPPHPGNGIARAGARVELQ
jgi:hypothetical protein